jgi:hypothetical protein
MVWLAMETIVGNGICQTCSLNFNPYSNNEFIKKNIYFFKGTFVHKKDDVTKDWRKLRMEELYNLYPLADIAILIKPRTMTSTEHLPCMAVIRIK